MSPSKHVTICLTFITFIKWCNADSILLDGVSTSGGSQILTPNRQPYIASTQYTNLPHRMGSETVYTVQGVYIIGGSKDNSTRSNVADVTVFIPSSTYTYAAESMRVPRVFPAAVAVTCWLMLFISTFVFLSYLQLTIIIFSYAVASVAIV
jgi:hypothetical protein